MVIQIRYIFGCSHEPKTILSTTIFEKGLEIPASFCEDCYKICSICLEQIKTKMYDQLVLCEKCYCNVLKVSEN